MNTRMPFILMACRDTSMAAGLGDVLFDYGLGVRAADYLQAAAAVEAGDADPLVLVPTLETGNPAEAWERVAEELTRNFELIQRFVRLAIARKSGGHVVVLLPAKAAMGDPSDSAAAALAGGMLSLVRTLALEFRKLGMTANMVLFESASGGTVGQAIYATGASDAGRLHP